MEANVKLQKHKAILENINESVTIQAADIKWIKKHLKTLDEEFKPILKKNEANCEAISNKPVPEVNSKVVVNTKKSRSHGDITDLLVTSANDITIDGVLSPLQELVLTAFGEIQNGGGQIKEVTHECMAIYIRFPTLKCWLEFHLRYLNGKIDSYFEPIQQHLRTYLGYEDLELTVDIYEEDFKANVQSIVFQLEAATDVNDDPCFAKQPSYSGSDGAKTEAKSIDSDEKPTVKVIVDHTPTGSSHRAKYQIRTNGTAGIEETEDFTLDADESMENIQMFWNTPDSDFATVATDAADVVAVATLL
ncbi:hypothetical protein DPMN_119140 [Dreissena polymorpha]|uniref:Uncharacterized protein n=1 Tax=Dreissena polymorpha TaxID=45954 RepID=A0A9D4GLG9_DREPO|nr:hypothetical protein DPMN_119140 [Dreissena polymorpha]